MAVPSRCLRRDFPKKVKSIFSYGIARKLENKLRMNFDAFAEFRETKGGDWISVLPIMPPIVSVSDNRLSPIPQSQISV